MKTFILSIVVVLATFNCALAESSVWKVEKDDSVLYLGGTCHMLRPSDFPLPPEFNAAYHDSDLLIFETDLGKLEDPSTQQSLIMQSMYTDGTTLQSCLSPETYRLLQNYCATNGIPLEAMQQFKPSMVALTITAIELAAMGVMQEGVDSFYYKAAMEDAKDYKSIETIEEQINYVVGMGEGNEDALIIHTLNEMDTIREDYAAMVQAWRSGDIETLNDLMINELKTAMPGLYLELVAGRNAKWLPVIENYLKTEQKEFVLVGAGHLVGTDGIIQGLLQKGFKVEKL